jgi:Cytochrome c oxidase subunit Vb/Cytosol aminopeptidase family, catalytic domain
MPIATGLEHEEIEAEFQGLKRFDVDAPAGPFGTKEAPAVVQSHYNRRLVGCPGGEGVDKIADLATLAGACIIALGSDIAGIFTPNVAEAALNSSKKKKSNFTFNSPNIPTIHNQIFTPN